MSSTSYSVFIPRVFLNISSSRITQAFHNLNIGEVDHVDLVKRSNEKGSFHMAFVHFKNLYDSNEAKSFQTDVENPDCKAKIVYDDPWYWFVMPFTKKEEVNQSFMNMNPMPTMMVPPVPGMMLFWSHGPQGPMYYWGYPNPPAQPNAMFTTPNQSFTNRQVSTPTKPIRKPKQDANMSGFTNRKLEKEFDSANEENFPSLEQSKNVTVRKKFQNWAEDGEEED